MQPLCHLRAVAVSDHQSRDIPPSRPSPDPPPRAMAGRDDRQADALSAACAKHCGIRFVVGAAFQA
jgi:hypothetical protein